MTASEPTPTHHVLVETTTFEDQPNARHLCTVCGAESVGEAPPLPCPGLERSRPSSRVDAAAGAAREDDRRVNYGLALTVPQTVAGQLSAVVAVADEEQAELRAEVERLQRLLDETDFALIQVRLRAEPAEARLGALVADLRGLADEWERHSLLILGAGGGVSMMAHSDAVPRLRAVLDKHAGEQAQGRADVRHVHPLRVRRGRPRKRRQRAPRPVRHRRVRPVPGRLRLRGVRVMCPHHRDVLTLATQAISGHRRRKTIHHIAAQLRRQCPACRSRA